MQYTVLLMSSAGLRFDIAATLRSMADAAVRSQMRETYEGRCKQFGRGERKWEWPRGLPQELLTDAIVISATQQKRDHIC